MEPDLPLGAGRRRRLPGPCRTASTDKYSRGVVGLDTGSVDYPGAGVLAATGALCAGAGMVRYLGPPRCVAPLVLDRCRPMSCRPGPRPGAGAGLRLGRSPGRRRRLVARAVVGGVPVVVDADALGLLPHRLHPQVLLTPHAGELARLLGIAREEVEADPLAAVRHAVASTGCTVLLKGATQYVATPGETECGSLSLVPAWTAQAGSGDVLAGHLRGAAGRGAGALRGCARRSEHPGDHRGGVSRSATPTGHC